MADRMLTQILNKMLGYNKPVMTLYPVTSGAPAGGAAIPSGAGVWGVYTDIIAAAGILVDFWLLQVQFDAVGGGAVQLFDVQIYNATITTTLYATKVDPTAATMNVPPITFMFPIYCVASSNIQGRAGGAAARTIGTSLLVATGL